MTSPASHIETRKIQGRRLGRRPHDPARPTLRMSRLLSGRVPAHPPTVDHVNRVTTWGMLANGEYGDCGPAAVVHDRMLTERYLLGVDFPGSATDALDLYKRSGNPRFPRDDNGVVLADMLAEVHKVGVGPVGDRIRSVAYAQVNVHDLDEVRAAVAIFGSLLLGVDLLDVQQDQTDAGGPWDLVTGSPTWGGHAVLAGRYSGDTADHHADLGVVTWGEVVGLTDAFWQAQVSEAWVVIWPEILSNPGFLAGVDQGLLAADYADLTGTVLPVAPPSPSPIPIKPSPPAPVPHGTIITPEQSAANTTLAAAAHPYVDHAHIGSNAAMAKQLTAWMKAWDL